MSAITLSVRTALSAAFLSLPFSVVISAWGQDREPQTDLSPQEVIVVSSRVAVPLREVGTAVSVITAEEIQLRGYNSMADVLRTQPGIGASSAGGAGKPTTVRIRGEEGYRTLVLFDGVRLVDPTTPQVGPTFEHMLTTSDIERVEILRGAQGFIYGADAGGVVNILTRAGEGPIGGDANIEIGEFNTRRLEGSLSGGNTDGDFFVAVSDFSSDGYNSRVSDTDPMDNDGYENTTMHTKLGWQPAADLRLQLVARDIDSENEFDRCGFPATNDCTGSSSQTTFRLSGDYDVGRFTHFLGVANTDVERGDFWAGVESFTTKGSIRRIEYTGSVELNAKSALVYGADLDSEAIVTSNGGDLARDQTGYYFEYQGDVGQSIFVTVGARHDDNDDFGEHTSVRVTAAYLQNLPNGATLKYRTSYGTGFRAPSLSEVAYNNSPFAFPPASEMILSEESSGGYDIGFEYVGPSALFVGVAYFDQEIEDEIFFDLAGFSGYLQAPGTNLSKGIELVTDYPVGPRWSILGNLTLNETKNQDGLQRIRRPEQLANIGLRFSSTDERLRLLANYRISRNAVDELFGVGRVPLDDYEVLDISAAYTVNENLEAFGRLENVTDEEYQEVIGFRSAGFAAYGGIRVRF